MERMKVERNRAGNKYTFTAEDKEDEKFLDRVNKKIDELEEENKKLRDYADNLDSENDNQAIEIEELKKERDLYKARNEELNENCFGLSKENKKLKAELEKLKSTYVYDAKQVRDIC